jgi:hypothetical protein
MRRHNDAARVTPFVWLTVGILDRQPDQTAYFPHEFLGKLVFVIILNQGSEGVGPGIFTFNLGAFYEIDRFRS